MNSICTDESNAAIKYRPKNSQTFVTAIEDYMKSRTTWIKSIFNQIKQHHIDRQAFSHLLSLDDHTLDDIGITRYDIYLANRLPMNVNASLELKKIARANQSQSK